MSQNRSKSFRRFGTQLSKEFKSDRSRAIRQFHSLRGQVLLRLQQWATGVAIMLIMAIMSIFAKKLKIYKKKTLRGNKDVSEYFQTVTALKHRNAKLILYPHQHFKILKKKQTCIHIRCQRNRDSWTSAAKQTETHSERAIGVHGEQRCRHRLTRGVDDIH